MTLLEAVSRSAAAQRCRIFLVTRDGRTAGRAGAMLARSIEHGLDIAGSASLAAADEAGIDRIIARAGAVGAHYVLVGLPEREAQALWSRARALDSAFAVIAVDDALERLAA